MQHTRASAANEKSEHFKQLKAAVDSNKMTIEQANEIILQHSKHTNKGIVKTVLKAAKVEETRSLIVMIKKNQAAQKKALTLRRAHAASAKRSQTIERQKTSLTRKEESRGILAASSTESLGTRAARSISI